MIYRLEVYVVGGQDKDVGELGEDVAEPWF